MSGRRPLNLGTAPSQPPGEAGQIVRWIDRAFRALELASNEDLATFFDEFGHEGTLVETRTIDLNTQGAIWEYRPGSHKGEHHGKERVIYLGPHAQEIIKPWLRTDLHAYLFSPREARAWHQAQRAKKRKTPAPSKPRSKRKVNPKRKPGEVYNTSAYEHAIARACVKAGVPVWAPNRLRHNAGTRIRSAYGIEAARVILGHSSAVTSEIYAEADQQKAREIMGKLG